eukprot:s4175_g8.t1
MLSAIQLVAKVSSMSEPALEKEYTSLCNKGSFQGLSEALFADDELPEGSVQEATDSKDACFELVSCIQREKKFIDPDITLEAAANDLDMEDPEEIDMKRMPDPEDLGKLFKADIAEDEQEDEKTQAQVGSRNPRTLMEVLDRARRESDHTFWNLLWRLNVYLRSSPGGMDVGWNERAIAMMNAEKETVQFRSRTSRLHKWRELVDKAHADLELPMASPDVIRSGHIVLFSLPCDSAEPQIELGMILTVWRGIKSPKPHSGDVQVTSCVAFRTVQLAMENQEAALVCEEPKHGDGKMKIILSDASADALSRVQGMKQWRVGPTMTRGSNKALDELPAPPKPDVKKRKAKAAAKPAATKESKEKKPKKAEPAISLDMGPDAFARKHPSRPQACKDFLEELLRIDKAAFHGVPLFNAEGVCRMKFDGAEKVTLSEVSRLAPNALEHMYRHVRKHKSFGKMVYKHLCDVKSNLMADHPKRNPMLKLVKEIGLFVLAQEAQEVGPQEN